VDKKRSDGEERDTLYGEKKRSDGEERDTLYGEMWKRAMHKYNQVKRESQRARPYEYSDDELGFADEDSYEDNSSSGDNDGNNNDAGSYESGDDDKRRKRIGLKKRQLSRTLALMKKRGLIAKRHRHSY
jgi:hypothetical protein